MSAVILLSLIVFLPAFATLAIMLIPSEQKDLIRWATLIVTAVVMVLILGVLIMPNQTGLRFDASQWQLQDTFNYGWIPSFNIDYFMGLGGISFPFLPLTAFVSLLAMAAGSAI